MPHGQSRDAAIDWDEGEFNGVQWFEFDEIPFARSDPNLGRFVAKLAGRGGRPS